MQNPCQMLKQGFLRYRKNRAQGKIKPEGGMMLPQESPVRVSEDAGAWFTG